MHVLATPHTACIHGIHSARVTQLDNRFPIAWFKVLLSTVLNFNKPLVRYSGWVQVVQVDQRDKAFVRIEFTLIDSTESQLRMHVAWVSTIPLIACLFTVNGWMDGLKVNTSWHPVANWSDCDD